MHYPSVLNYKITERLISDLEIHDLKDMYHKISDVITTTHRTDFYNIIWFQEGFSNHFVDFQEVDVSPGTILFIGPEIIHRFAENNLIGGKVIIFKESFFCKTEWDTQFLKNNSLFNKTTSFTQIALDHQKEAFESLLNLIETELNSSQNLGRADFLRHLLSSLLLISERENVKEATLEIVNNNDLDLSKYFHQLLETNFKKEKTVLFYTETMFLTEKRLNHITSATIGLSPKQIILDRINLEAKRHLLYSNLSIKEISFDLGFAEPTNFVRFFKKYSQFTPQQFRLKYTSA